MNSRQLHGYAPRQERTAAMSTEGEPEGARRVSDTSAAPAGSPRTGVSSEDPAYDVIVIGAGANGAGIARDAALRGLRVCLLEKEDICAGTSSWNGRCIHGGLRYLEHMDVLLVRESLRERERLFRHAPHLVKPVPFFIPFYSKNKRPSWMIRMGMLAFDVLSYDKSVAHHRVLSRDKALARFPGMNTETLTGAAVYMDGQVELSERLCVELAVAARADGAIIRTHARVDEAIVEDRKVRGVRYVDELTGIRHEVRAPVVLNVAGPWVDRVFTGVDPKRLIGGTKGSHLIVDRFPGAPTDVIYYEFQIDQRLVLVIPWLNRLLIGTTDIRYEGNPDDVAADAGEVDYLLSETNRLIPGAGLTPDSVLYTFSGVRPLPYMPGKAESALPRSHVIYDHKGKVDGLLSIVGGKLTTFRSLAEDAVDATYKKLGRKAPPCTTHQVPLPGGRVSDFAKFRDDFVPWSGLPTRSAERLANLYGARAVDVLELAGGSAELRAPIDEATGAIGAELLFAVEHEFAKTLIDVYMRRTMIGLEPGHGLDSVDRAAQILGDRLGWNADDQAEQTEAYRRYLRRFAVPGRAPAAGSSAVGPPPQLMELEAAP